MSRLKRSGSILAAMLAVLLLSLQIAGQSHTHHSSDPFAAYADRSVDDHYPVFSALYEDVHHHHQDENDHERPLEPDPHQTVCGLCIIATVEEDALPVDGEIFPLLWTSLGSEPCFALGARDDHFSVSTLLVLHLDSERSDPVRGPPFPA